MRVIAMVAAIVLSALSNGGAQVKTPDRVKQTGLLVGHRVDEYFGEAYTARSREDFVFFHGEPITYRVAVHNMGTGESALVVGSTNPQQLFNVKGLKAPPLPLERINGERPLSNGRYLDEVDINVPLRFSSPVNTWFGGEYAIPLDREIRLDPGESVEWVVNLPADLDRACIALKCG